VGEEQPRRADVRVLAATNRVLRKEVAAGRFREDLYYRLNVFPIAVAPLRQRREDIPALAAHLLEHACQRLHLRRPRLSRGHVRQLQQYDCERAGVEPRGSWYVRAGAGMGAVLRMAGEKRAYTLADRGTFLAVGASLDLAVVSEGDPLLVNPYSVILVSPAKHPHVHAEAARRFADFLLGPEARQVIADFGKERYGRALFVAGAPAGQ
jgi:hypothetical protein